MVDITLRNSLSRPLTWAEGDANFTNLKTAVEAVESAAGVNFVQSGTGAATRTVQEKLRDVVSVLDFGAVGDGTTDDSTAIQAAATYLATLDSGTDASTTKRGKTLWFPGGYAYLSSVGITVAENISIHMEGPLIVQGAAGTAVVGLTIGHASIRSRGNEYHLDVRRQTQSNWSVAGDIGIKFRNVTACRIFIKRTQGWYIGAQFAAIGGGTGGCYFNHVSLGDIRGAKYGVQIYNDGAGSATNANNFYGGEFGTGSGEGVDGESRYGFHLTGNGNNTNQFFGPSFELNATLANPGEAIPFLIDGTSSRNRGYSIRSEGNTDTLVKITADAGNNFFTGSYTVRSAAWPSVTGGGISDTSKWQTNVVFTHYDELMARSFLIFDSGELGRKVNVYDGSSTFTVDGFDISDSAFTLFTAQNNIAPQDDDTVRFAVTNRNLVRFIDTRVNKRFIVFYDTGSTSETVSFAVKPYDAKRDLLSDNPTPAYVYGEDTSVFAWNGSAHAGCYVASGENTYARIYFAVDTNTKSVAFIFPSAVGHDLKSLRIYALDYPCTTWQEKREREFNGKMIATAIPTVGTWTRGDRIYNHTPSAAGTEGWVCVTSGTFGTLSSCTADTTASSVDVTVNDASNLQVGMYITIAGVTGVKRIVGISGTDITIDSTANATVDDGAVAYQAPTLKTFGSIAS